MSLLSYYLNDAMRAELTKRETPGGIRLEDVIRSGLCHPDSAVGVYAPDAQSYGVFRELFEPILLVVFQLASRVLLLPAGVCHP